MTSSSSSCDFSQIKIHFLVYLGVNDKKVDYVNTNLKGLTQYEYGVEWGKAHPNFRGTAFDIGLYRLNRDVVFETDFLQPICLPLKFDKTDTVKSPEELDVYTSGNNK